MSRHSPYTSSPSLLLSPPPTPVSSGPLLAPAAGTEIMTYITQRSTAAFATQSRHKLAKDFNPLTFEPLKDYVHVWAGCINPIPGKYCPLGSVQRQLCVLLEPPSSVNRGDYRVKNRRFYTLHAAIVVVRQLCVCVT